MSVNFLNQNLTANPQLAHIVMRTLVTLGPMALERLESIVRPGIVQGAPNQWVSTLAVLEGVGIIDVKDGVHLRIEFAVDPDHAVRPERFRRAFLRQLVIHSREAVKNGEELNDLVQQLLWTQLVTSSDVFDSDGRQADLSQRAFNLHGFATDSKWPRFCEWGIALGFLRSLPGGSVTADYLEIVQQVVLTETSQGPSGLLDAFNEACPSIADPSFAAWCNDHSAGDRADQLPEPVAWAMLSLELRGELQLESKDDAADRKRLTGSHRTFTGVRGVVK